MKYTVKYDSVKYNAVKYDIVQYDTVKCTRKYDMYGIILY
jgi:hypothetical protein